MLFDDNSNYKLSYKTGWGWNEKRKSTGLGSGLDRGK